MKNCKNCGAEMADEERICPSCGFEEVKAPKKKTGLIIGIVALVLVLIAGTATAATLRMLNSPERLLGAAFKNLAQEAVQYTPDSLVTQLQKSGKLQLSFEQTVKQLFFGDATQIYTLTYAYNNEENQKMVDIHQKTKSERGNSNLRIMGFYQYGDTVVVGSELIPMKTLGTDFSIVEEKLGSSVFAPNSGSRYALPQNVYDALLEYCKDYHPGARPEPLDIAAYLKDMSFAGKDYAALEKAEETFAELPCYAVTMTMEAKGIVAMVDAMLQRGREDPAFLNAMDNLAMTAPELYDDLSSWDSQQKQAELAEKGAKFSIVFHITKDGKILRGVDICTVSDDVNHTIAASVSEHVFTDGELSLQFLDGENVTLSYAQHAGEEDSFLRELTVCNAEGTELSLRVEQSAEEVCLVLSEDGEDIVIRASMERSDNTMTIRVLEITNQNGTNELPVTVTITGGAEMEELPKYRDIFSFSEKELDDMGLGFLVEIAKMAVQSIDM